MSDCTIPIILKRVSGGPRHAIMFVTTVLGAATWLSHPWISCAALAVATVLYLRRKTVQRCFRLGRWQALSSLKPHVIHHATQSVKEQIACARELYQALTCNDARKKGDLYPVAYVDTRNQINEIRLRSKKACSVAGLTRFDIAFVHQNTLWTHEWTPLLVVVAKKNSYAHLLMSDVLKNVSASTRSERRSVAWLVYSEIDPIYENVLQRITLQTQAAA